MTQEKQNLVSGEGAVTATSTEKMTAKINEWATRLYNECDGFTVSDDIWKQIDVEDYDAISEVIKNALREYKDDYKTMTQYLVALDWKAMKEMLVGNDPSFTHYVVKLSGFSSELAVNGKTGDEKVYMEKVLTANLKLNN